jgi:hypothetical protein
MTDIVSTQMLHVPKFWLLLLKDKLHLAKRLTTFLPACLYNQTSSSAYIAPWPLKLTNQPTLKRKSDLSFPDSFAGRWVPFQQAWVYQEGKGMDKEACISKHAKGKLIDNSLKVIQYTIKVVFIVILLCRFDGNKCRTNPVYLWYDQKMAAINDSVSVGITMWSRVS